MARWCCVLLAMLCGCGETRSGADVKFETAKVDRGNIAAKVTASGAVNALVTVQVGTQVSGRLQDILVDFNTPVKKGQVLARIDPRFFNAALEQARANLEAAEGNLAKALVEAAEQRRRWERVQALVTQGTLAAAEAETAKAVMEGAEATVRAVRGGVAQSKANVKQAEINLNYATIHSPIDGMVISRNVDVGQTVAASFQAPTLFTIAEDLRKMQVDTAVSEADIGRLKAEMDAVFTVDAYPGRKFKGRVRQIRNAPVTLANVVTYTVVIDVENPEMLLKPGMTATVNVTHADRESVLRVPNGALRFRPSPEVLARYNKADGGRSAHPETSRIPVMDKSPEKRTVWLLKDGVPTSAQITVGITDGTLTEVTGGDIKEGDTLITEAITPQKAGQPMGGPGMRRVL